ncbi:hypothetical protein [Actinomadura sp. B10D3]|uniref:hypothetical protein n=1 Tax=Actinomadura sp. B10D3 TaxID=3153557 RepID=UPI00325C7648
MAEKPEKKITMIAMGGFTFPARVTELPEDADTDADTDGGGSGSEDQPQDG